MKAGLSASISRLVNGEQRRSSCFANGFSRSLESILFNGSYLRVFRCHESSRTFSSCSEDAFEELGPPSEGLATQFKLRTQKPEQRHLRNGPRKELNRSTSPHGSRPSISSIFPNFNKPSKTSKPTLQDRENVSGDMKNSSKSDSCSVTAEDVTDEVDNRASTDSKIVTIRIQDIAKETTYHIIHSICKSVGVLEGLAKTKEDAVDVFFRVNNVTDSQNILKRLNSTVIDESRWSAYELPKNSTSSSSSTIEDDQCKTSLQINNALSDLKQQLTYKKICCEDFELLHMSVMHLEGWPKSYKE